MNRALVLLIVSVAVVRWCLSLPVLLLQPLLARTRPGSPLWRMQ